MPGEPKLVRVDERLVHGQVVVAWLKHLSCSSVCIVDDEVSGDQYIQEVFKMALGTGNRLVVCTAHEAPSYWTGWEDSLVLVRNVLLACEIFEGGAVFSRLNLGGMGKRIGRIKLLDNIYVLPEEMDSLRFLRDSGVHLFYQSVPAEAPVDLGPYLDGKTDGGGAAAEAGGELLNG
ncbi:MAG TPA: PTS sugar transporter subunit IIB [Firmicutes bacterium]|nr:PTS sugar transporter subunit IIB [Candidatus Fermentithermobacillaceae bacterium]